MIVSNQIVMRVLSVQEGRVALEFTFQQDGEPQVVITQRRLEAGHVLELLGSGVSQVASVTQ